MKLKMEEIYLKTLKRIRVELADNTKFNPDLEASFGKSSPPMQPNCRLFEMNTSHVPKRIKIDLLNSENVSLHLNIVEKNMALARRRQHSFAYRGPFIEIEGLNTIKTFGLSLKQSHYSEQDEKINCITLKLIQVLGLVLCPELTLKIWPLLPSNFSPFNKFEIYEWILK